MLPALNISLHDAHLRARETSAAPRMNRSKKNTIKTASAKHVEVMQMLMAMYETCMHESNENYEISQEMWFDTLNSSLFFYKRKDGDYGPNDALEACRSAWPMFVADVRTMLIKNERMKDFERGDTALWKNINNVDSFALVKEEGLERLFDRAQSLEKDCEARIDARRKPLHAFQRDWRMRSTPQKVPERRQPPSPPPSSPKLLTRLPAFRIAYRWVDAFSEEE